MLIPRRELRLPYFLPELNSKKAPKARKGNKYPSRQVYLNLGLANRQEEGVEGSRKSCLQKFLA